MPEAAVAVAEWWAAMSTAEAALFVAKVVVSTAMVYGNVQQRQSARRLQAAQRAAANANLQDRTISIVSADNPLQVVYGEATVGPAYVAILTSGDRDQFKHVVCVWAAHPCQAITDLQLAGTSVGTLDGSGYPTGGRWVRSETITESEFVTVSGGTITVAHPVARVLGVSYITGSTTNDYPEYLDLTGVTTAGAVLTLSSPLASTWNGRGVWVNYEWTKVTPYLRVRHHLGDPDQAADAALLAEVPGDWTSSDRGRGLCYSVLTFDLNEPEFQGGPPQPTATVRGRLVYDPRADSTQPGGSGAQRADNPATWTWSRNVALCTADFIRAEWGKRAPTGRVQWPTVMAAANACDVGVDYGAGTEALYECDGAFRSDEDPDATLDALCQAMAGFATCTGGAWAVQAGAWTAPVMDLTDADNAGAVELVAGLGVDEVVNGLRGQYYDPGKFSQVTDYPPYQNAGFVAEDGAAYFGDLQLPWTRSAARCHQLARVQVERTRGMQLSYPAKLRAVKLRPGQRVRLSCAVLNLVNATFRVVKREWTPGGAVKLTLAADDATFYDLVDAPAVLAVPTLPNSDPWRVDPVTTLNARTGSGALVTDPNGQIISRVRLTFDASTDALVRSGGALEVQYRLDTDTAWTAAPEGPGTAAAYDVPGLRENRLYMVRVRWRNALGAVGDWRGTPVLTDVMGRPPVNSWRATLAGPVTYSTIA